MNLTIMTPIKGYSDFACFGRGLIKHLECKAVIKLIEVPFSTPHLVYEDHDTLVKFAKIEETNLFYQDSSIFQCSRPGAYIGRDVFKQSYGYSFFDYIPLVQEIEAYNRMDKIFVPSSYFQRLLLRAGVTKPVLTLPPGLDYELFSPSKEKLNLGQKFNFLSVGEIKLENGFDFVIDAFLDCFGNNKEVGLILFWINKLNSPEDINQMKTFVETRRRQRGITGGNISFINFDTYLYEKDLKMLYSSCDVLLAPLRVTSWPKEIYQSLACETPVIVSALESVSDYLTPEYVSFVKCYLPQHPDITNSDNIIKPSIDVDYNHLRLLMLDHYTNYDKYKKKAINARKYLIEKISWHNIILKLLSEIK